MTNPSGWAANLLSLGNFAILDTETTGLDRSAEICQIALCDSEGQPLLNTLVNPTVPITPEAHAIHKISDDDVATAPSFDQVLLKVLRAVGTRDVVIYNAEFDLKLIKQSLRPYGIQLAFPTSDRRGCRIFLNGGSIHCAMLKFAEFVGEWNDYQKSYRWQKLIGGDHTALGDCLATLNVIRKMAEGVNDVE